jgi:hypothetical protein
MRVRLERAIVLDHRLRATPFPPGRPGAGGGVQAAAAGAAMVAIGALAMLVSVRLFERRDLTGA